MEKYKPLKLDLQILLVHAFGFFNFQILLTFKKIVRAVDKILQLLKGRMSAVVWP